VFGYLTDYLLAYAAYGSYVHSPAAGPAPSASRVLVLATTKLLCDRSRRGIVTKGIYVMPCMMDDVKYLFVDSKHRHTGYTACR